MSERKPDKCRTHRPTSPPTLVAIILAARQSGDRGLEEMAKRELREEYGITLNLPRKEPTSP